MKKKTKILIICVIMVIVLAVCGGVGYILYENYQGKLEKESQEIILSMQEKYNTLKSESDLLILSEEEQTNINAELESIKKAIEQKNITEENHNAIDSINGKIQEIKTNNNSLLTNKENELNGINIDKFNEEQKNKVTELQNQYNELKNNGKYKEAQAKIQEIIDYKNNTNAEITKAEEEKAKQEAEQKKQVASQNNNKTPSTSKPSTSTTNTSTPSTSTPSTSTPSTSTPSTSTPSTSTPSTNTPTTTEPEKPVTPTQPEKMYDSEAIDISYTGTYDDETRTYTIKGTITNKTNYSFSKVVSSFRIEDYTGSGIGSAQTTIMSVKPNSTRSFSCSTRYFSSPFDPVNCTNTSSIAYK